MILATHVERRVVEPLFHRHAEKENDDHAERVISTSCKNSTTFMRWKWPNVQLVENDRDVGELLIQTNKASWFDALLMMQMLFPADKTVLTPDAIKLLLTPLPGATPSPNASPTRKLSRALSRAVPKDVAMTREVIYPTCFPDMWRVFRPVAELLANLHIDVDVVLYDTPLREPLYVLVRVNPKEGCDDITGSTAARMVVTARFACAILLNKKQAVPSRVLFHFLAQPANPRRPVGTLRITAGPPKVANAERHAKPTVELISAPPSSRPIITISEPTTRVKSMALRCYTDEAGHPTLIVFLTLPIDANEAATAPLFQCEQLVSARMSRECKSIFGQAEQEKASFGNACDGEPRSAVAIIVTFEKMSSTYEGGGGAEKLSILRHEISHCEIRPDVELSLIDVEVTLRSVLNQKPSRSEGSSSPVARRGMASCQAHDEELADTASRMLAPEVAKSLMLLHALASNWATIEKTGSASSREETMRREVEEDDDASDSDDDEPTEWRGSHDQRLTSLPSSSCSALVEPGMKTTDQAGITRDEGFRFLNVAPSADVARILQFAEDMADTVVSDNIFRRWRWFAGKTLRRESSCDEETQRWRRELRSALGSKFTTNNDEHRNEHEEQEQHTCALLNKMIDSSETRKDFRRAWRFAYKSGIVFVKKRLRDVIPSTVDLTYALKPCKYRIHCDWRLFSATHVLTEYPSLVFLYLAALRADPTDDEELAFKSHLDEYIIPTLRRVVIERRTKIRPTILDSNNRLHREAVELQNVSGAASHRTDAREKTTKGGSSRNLPWVPNEDFWNHFDRRLARRMPSSSSGSSSDVGGRRCIFSGGWITRVASAATTPTHANEADVSAAVISAATATPRSTPRRESQRAGTHVVLDSSNPPNAAEIVTVEEVNTPPTPVVVYFRCDELSICDNIPARWVADTSKSSETTSNSSEQTPRVGQCVQIVLRLSEEDPAHPNASKPVHYFLFPPAGTAGAAQSFAMDRNEAARLHYERQKALYNELEICEEEQAVRFRGLRAEFFCMENAKLLDEEDVKLVVPLPAVQASRLVGLYKQRLTVA